MRHFYESVLDVSSGMFDQGLVYEVAQLRREAMCNAKVETRCQAAGEQSQRNDVPCPCRKCNTTTE